MVQEEEKEHKASEDESESGDGEEREDDSEEEEEDDGEAEFSPNQSPVIPMSNKYVPEGIVKNDQKFMFEGVTLTNESEREVSIQGTIEQLPLQLWECIKEGKGRQVMKLLKDHKVQSLSWIKVQSPEPLPVRGIEFDNGSGEIVYESAMWNPILYAIYY